MSTIRKKLGHIRPSWRAIVVLWHEELSFRIQVLAGLIAILLSLVLEISMLEFLIVLLVIGAVFAVEALNTALEELCDHVTPELHPQIGKVKDLGSAASGLIGVFAIIIGLIIFIPHII